MDLLCSLRSKDTRRSSNSWRPTARDRWAWPNIITHVPKKQQITRLFHCIAVLNQHMQSFYLKDICSASPLCTSTAAHIFSHLIPTSLCKSNCLLSGLSFPLVKKKRLKLIIWITARFLNPFVSCASAWALELHLSFCLRVQMSVINGIRVEYFLA